MRSNSCYIKSICRLNLLFLKIVRLSTHEEISLSVSHLAVSAVRHIYIYIYIANSDVLVLESYNNYAYHTLVHFFSAV